jgi:transmembrane sensor
MSILLGTACIFITSSTGPSANPRVTVRTGIGEWKIHSFGDKSLVRLNTATEAIVRDDKMARSVVLPSGEVYVDAQSDPSRPFRVIAECYVFEALGTSYDVRVDGNNVYASVVQGSVAVRQQLTCGHSDMLTDAPVYKGSKFDGAEALVLKAGDSIVATRGKTLHVELQPRDLAEVGRQTEWLRRRLIYQGKTLAAVVADVNRYTRDQLLIADPALGNVRIVGVFQCGNVDGVLDALLQNYHITATVVLSDGSHRVIDLRWAVGSGLHGKRQAGG